MHLIFESERLIMREFTAEDVKEIYHYSREESMKKGIPDQVYESLEEARETIEFLMSCYAGNINEIKYPYVLGVAIKETQQLIGHIGLSKIPEGIEIGYAIGENYQRKGYCSEAICALVDWAKEVLKISVIYAVVMHDNIGSCRALEKAGFVLQKEEIRESFGNMYQRKVYTK